MYMIKANVYLICKWFKKWLLDMSCHLIFHPYKHLKTLLSMLR